MILSRIGVPCVGVVIDFPDLASYICIESKEMSIEASQGSEAILGCSDIRAFRILSLCKVSKLKLITGIDRGARTVEPVPDAEELSLECVHGA